MKSVVTLALLLALFSCSKERPASAAEPQPSPTATSEPAALPAVSAPKVSGERALRYTREVVGFGPRPVGSAAHKRLEGYLRSKLKDDNLEEDAFTANTPVGTLPMRNFIAKFPGMKDGVIVISGHYDTLYGRNDFVGANDGGSSTGVLLAIADAIRGRKLDGYSIWLVWFDGEEAVQQWSPTDGIYGSRHLADKWRQDGTSKKIKALLVLDMIGDADLSIDRDSNSTPWLLDLVYQAAAQLGYQSHFFRRGIATEDDHTPFVRLGVPAADIIDFDYGYANAFWHTPQDTLDKVSAGSLQIAGDVALQAAWLLSATH